MALATFFIFTSVFSLFYVAALALIIIPEDLFAPSQQEFPPQISKTTRKTRSQTANLLLLLEMSLYPLMTQYQMTHYQLWSKSPETYLIYRKIF